MANKGSGFERQQCKQWSLWFTNNEDDSVFWRTDGSGGRAKTNASRKLLYDYGDMKFTLPIGEPLIKSIPLQMKLRVLFRKLLKTKIPELSA